jgi:hypothetical protein
LTTTMEVLPGWFCGDATLFGVLPRRRYLLR